MKIIGALTLVLLIGCSSNVSLKDSHQSFVTKIGDDGSKTFVFGISVSPEVLRKQMKGIQKVDSTTNTRRSGRRGKGETVSANNRNNNRKAKKLGIDKEDLEEQLTLLFENNGYCRDGYIELESFVDVTSAHLRGECNESATEADRKRFPN